MRNGYHHLFLLYLFSLFPALSFSQNFAPKEFYLVDSLILEELVIDDRKLLDSCLTIYHNSKEDTLKLKALSRICGQMDNEYYWVKYQFKLLGIVERQLKKNNSSTIEKFMKTYLAESLNNASIIYLNRGNIPLALEYNFKSLKIKQELGDKLRMSVSLNNIAYVYTNQGNNKLALTYFYKSLKINKELDNKYGIAVLLHNIGNIFNVEGNLVLAMNNFVKSLKLYTEIDHKRGIANVNCEIGSILMKQDSLPLALEYFHKSLEIHEEIQYKMGMSNALMGIGSLYFKQDKLDKSLYFAKRSLKLAQELGFPEKIQKVAKIIYEIYEKKGNSVDAFEMYKLHIKMKDSVHNAENQKIISQLETKHLIEEKNRKILLLNKDKKLKETKFQFKLILYGSIILFIFILGSFVVFKKKRKYEKELKALRTFKLEANDKSSTEELTSIPITIGKNIISLKLEDVVYFKIQEGYVFLVNESGRSYIIDHSLSSLEKSLPKNFVRVHRSSIVNTEKVQKIKKTTRGKVILTMNDKPNSKVSTGVAYNDSVKTIIANFK